MMRAYLTAGSCSLLALTFVFGGGAAPKKEDIPKYLKALQTSKDAKERATAASMIGRRGAVNVGDVKDAVEPLKERVQSDADAGVRKAAATALGQIGPEPATTVPLLTEVVQKDKSLDVKLAAVEALTQFGPNAKSALPAIRKLLGATKDNKKVAVRLKAAVKAISAK
jgi:HEAT repeat protein